MSEERKKAEQLVEMFLDKLYNNGELSFKRILHAKAVECSKILADEMLFQYSTLNSDLINGIYRCEKIVFWQSVRRELDYVIFITN